MSRTHWTGIAMLFATSFVWGQSFERLDASIKDDLHSLNFYGNYGWAIGYGTGNLYHSSDKGRSWKLLWKGDSLYVEEIQFVSDKAGYMVGERGNLLYTKNSGQSWNNQLPEQFRDKNLLIYGAHFLNEKNGLVSCQTNSSPATIYNLLLQEGEWQLLADSSHAFLKISAVNRESFLGCTVSEIVLFDRKLEHKRVLYKKSSNAIGLLRDVGAIGNLFYAIGSKGYFIYSVDEGTTWKELAVSTTRLRSLAFINHKQGYIVGDQGLIMQTRDGGLSWTQQDTPWKEDLHRIVQHRKSIRICGRAGLLLTRVKND